MSALVIEKRPDPAPSPLLPDSIAVRLAEFMLDKRTGNVVLNIKDGKILAAQVTDFLNAR